MKTKITKQCYLASVFFVQVNFFRVLSFKNKLQSILMVFKKIVEICTYPKIHVYIYMIYST